MRNLRKIDPEIYRVIKAETQRQHENIELIASENFASPAVLEAMGSSLTNKYAEGYPKNRWYGGCEFVDHAETLAIDRAKKLFGAEYANVQPHSGTQANMAVFYALLEPGDTVLAMDLACGGHLSHGHKHNYSGKYYNVVSYGVDRKTETLDYAEIEKLAIKHKPKLILSGASAYPRKIEFDKFKKIADKVGAITMADIAHIAGLIVAGLHPDPVPVTDIVTTTTHKTMRGPRGGMILCKKGFGKQIDAQVFPGIQGGPLEHIIAAKAVALEEALQPGFKNYQKQIINNAKALADELAGKGYRLVSGGTDNHLMLLDLTEQGVTGKKAALWLDQARITVNKNLIPFDTKSAFETSGIRIGTPAATTRGMKEPEMQRIAAMIDEVIKSKGDHDTIQEIRKSVHELTEKFPLYDELRKELE